MEKGCFCGTHKESVELLWCFLLGAEDIAQQGCNKSKYLLGGMHIDNRNFIRSNTVVYSLVFIHKITKWCLHALGIQATPPRGWRKSGEQKLLKINTI